MNYFGLFSGVRNCNRTNKFEIQVLWDHMAENFQAAAVAASASPDEAKPSYFSTNNEVSLSRSNRFLMTKWVTSELKWLKLSGAIHSDENLWSSRFFFHQKQFFSCSDHWSIFSHQAGHLHRIYPTAIAKNVPVCIKLVIGSCNFQLTSWKIDQ